jgi:hypothetical protein
MATNTPSGLPVEPLAEAGAASVTTVGLADVDGSAAAAVADVLGRGDVGDAVALAAEAGAAVASTLVRGAAVARRLAAAGCCVVSGEFFGFADGRGSATTTAHSVRG